MVTAAFGYLFNHVLSQQDVLPSRGGQVARIIADAGGVESFKPVTTFEPYYETAPDGTRRVLRIDTAQGTIEATSRVDRYQLKHGGTLVVQDHHLGHSNAGQRAQAPHFNAHIEGADGKVARTLTVNGDVHFRYQPTHAYTRSTIRYSGSGQMVRPSTIAIMRASGWMY